MFSSVAARIKMVSLSTSIHHFSLQYQKVTMQRFGFTSRIVILASAKTFARKPVTENGVISLVTGQFADKPTRGQSSRGLVNSRIIVNSPKCLLYNLEYIIAISVISDRLQYLYAANIR